jgi:copper chaperone
MGRELNFKVEMACGGCSGAVTRILKKIDGVEDVTTNLETQAVKVQCAESVDPQKLLDALKKWASASNKQVELIA